MRRKSSGRPKLFYVQAKARYLEGAAKILTRQRFTWIIFIISFGIVIQLYTYFLTSLKLSFPIEQSFSGAWDVCLPTHPPNSENCQWQKISVPGDLPLELQKSHQGWLIYRRTFTAPPHCLTHPAHCNCSLFFGEVGDTAEASLNGVSLGRRGEFPPHARYAKHYPAQFDLSRNILKPGKDANTLVLTVYSMKKIQAGIRRGPIGIFTGSNGFKVAQAFIIVTILVPILGCLGLFLIGVLATIACFIYETQDGTLHSYIRYCFIASLFLLSFSEIPREYLPIWVAGYLHFMIRFLSDWAYFELIREYYDFGRWTEKIFRPLYGLGTFAFLLNFTTDIIRNKINNEGSGFDSACVIIKIVFPLLFVPHLMGMIGSFRRRNIPFEKCLFLFFSLLLVLQAHDTLIFHQYLTGSYAVKFYPFLIGLALGVRFLERSKNERSRILMEREQSRQMKKIHTVVNDMAHELRAPLAGLKMACDQLAQDPGNRELVQTMVRVFPKQADRLFQLSTAVLKYSKELCKGVELNKEETDLNEFIQSVIDDFSLGPQTHPLEIEFQPRTNEKMAFLDRFQMKQVMNNLLHNSAEACVTTLHPKVQLAWIPPSILHPWVELKVSDNGPGIAPQIRDKVFEPFTTYGKQNGIGLGLTLSKRIVEAHGGQIRIHTKETGSEF